MTRFFAVLNNPLEGTHLHLVWTSHKRTLREAIDEMNVRIQAGAVSSKPLFFDFGPGDSDLRRLDKHA